MQAGTATRILGMFLSFGVSMALVAGLAAPAAAQQQKEKKKKDLPSSNGTSSLPMSDEQQIDYMISTMLGNWQLGNLERLHESYADDVTIVNGMWGPPIIGWANYAPLYEQQRARVQQVRMDRSNTLIRISGTVAWACYQWEFSATVDGQPSTSQGQTTLVMEKRNSRWVIVHNHTALVQAAPKNPGNTPPATQPPAKPASP